MTVERKNYRVVYTVVERNERRIWVRVGAAFENRDGSLNVLLDAIPINGRLQIRDWVPSEERARQRGEFRLEPPKAIAS